MNLKRPILIVQNNTGNSMPVNLFSASPNASGGINAHVQYKWDITFLALNQLTDVQLQVGSVGSPGISTINMKILASTVAGVLDALNALNVGFFRSITSGGSTFIVTNNKAFTFGNMIINQPPTWSNTGGVQINNPNVSSTLITTSDTRSGPVVSFAEAGPFVPPFFLPYVGTDSSFLPGFLLDGDPMQTSIFCTVVGTFSAHLILKQNGVIILDDTQVGITAVFDFNYSLNTIYDFNVTIN